MIINQTGSVGSNYTGQSVSKSTDAGTETHAVGSTTGSDVNLNEDRSAPVQTEETNDVLSTDQDERAAKATNDALRDAVEKINRTQKNTEAVFGIHEKTNRVTIKIIDKDTKKVIKEYPPEKTLDILAKAWELAGIMVDEKR